MFPFGSTPEKRRRSGLLFLLSVLAELGERQEAWTKPHGGPVKKYTKNTNRKETKVRRKMAKASRRINRGRK